MDVIIKAVHQLTETIRAYELIHPQGDVLPEFSAGAHIDVHLDNGLIRQYSLANCSTQRQRYVIAVLNDAQSRGGSRFIHEYYQAGDRLKIGTPRNLFALDADQGPVMLFAGGIGITPILSMAYSLQAQGRAFELHYFVRSHAAIAFYGNLTAHFKDQVFFHINEQPETRCDLPQLLANPAADQQLYVCGPNGFMQSIFQSALDAGWSTAQLHQEHFVAESTALENAESFTIQVQGFEQTIEVAADQTASQALIAHGFDIPVACEQGICGSCVTKVVSGTPDHRDVFLTDEERAKNDRFTPCCSRAKHKHLVIAL